MKCAVCGCEYHTNFCPDCGSAQPQSAVCVGCGLSHAFDFCPSCGTAGNALACLTENGLQEVRPTAPEAPGGHMAPRVPAYPPAGTYPPPPVAQPLGSQPVLGQAGMPSMPSITVHNTSLTGDANTVVTLAPWPSAQPAYPYAQKNKLLAFILCFFFGFWGVHRFYTGKIGTGLLWLFSGGLFGIGWLVDVISIAAGGYRDANGQFLSA